MQESGVAGFNATTWFGVLAPAKLSAELTSRIHEALRTSASTPEARQALKDRGVEPVFDTPAHFQAELEEDLARWREVTRKAKISLD